MKNKFKITSITIQDNRIDYQYEISGEWKKYFNREDKLFIEYAESIEATPYGVAVVPLLCNVLPIAWIFNAEISLDEIDKDFYESIEYFKQGYIDMYPKINFLGKIKVNKVIKYYNENSNKSLALFSGGVDAFYTFLSNIEEKPCITTLWGADIKLQDFNGWNKVLNHTKKTAELYNVNYTWIKSNFKQFINESNLTNAVYSRANDGWWHGFQHGIGLIGNVAPYVYKNNINKVYIAASYTIKEKGKVTCASDPTIDNNLKFCGCYVKHDGYESTRQDKIKFICNYSKANKTEIPMRVCWQSSGGSNCCKCEKCYRTIFGILAEREDPTRYGFNYTDKEFDNIVKDLKKRIYILEENWKYIEERFKQNYTIKELDRNLYWLYKKDISYINKSHHKVITKIKNKCKEILFKLYKNF